MTKTALTGTPVYQNPALPFEQRVDDLVGRMTLAEKVSQMVYTAAAIPRLGVPEYNWWNESLHGVARAGAATVFPQAIGLAATWNAPLIHQVADTIATEGRAKHHEFLRMGIRYIYAGLTYWTPNINIFRDPRWGRGQETYGEDPYLTARFGVAFIKGLQGDDPRYLKSVATPKHYAVHSGPEPDRHTFDARVDERDLRETYLPAFEACVREGKAISVMGAYNRTNGDPCCAHPTLLEQILRQEWGFDGYVVSDCWAICDIFRNHKVVETIEQAAALAVRNGCDLNCGYAFTALMESVGLGYITEEEITRAVKRLFMARFRLGMFDPPEQVPYAQIPYSVNNCAAHQALALETARQTMVLLKNDGLLPLDKNVKSIAVIGPNADDATALHGNYYGTWLEATTPLEGIRRKVSPQTKVYYAPGCFIADGMPLLGPVPASALRPATPSTDQFGLTGHYYGNPRFEGQPSITRLDAGVNFIWRDTTPVTGRRADPFAVHWTGYLVPPVSGTYQLGVCGRSEFKLLLGNELFVEVKDIEHEPATAMRAVELEAGRYYSIQLDMANVGPDPHAMLLWHAPGFDYTAQALDVAQKADVVVMVMGLASNLEGEEMAVKVEGFDRGDRTDIKLPHPQEELLQRIHALGKPVVLVLMNGSALAVNWADEHLPAIVEAWYPGQAGGAALADVLFGDYNPAGRLPLTFYKSIEQVPPFDDYRMAGRTYRYFSGEPLYPFGYGLSYTRFEYSNLKITSNRAKPTSAETANITASITVTVDVQNVGPLAGDEVVQLYVSDVAASVPVPLRHLEGFTRIHLLPGQKQSVSFELVRSQFTLIDDAGQRVIEPGEFVIAVGGGQPGARAGSGNVVSDKLTVA